MRGVRVGFAMAATKRGSLIEVIDPVPLELDERELLQTTGSRLLGDSEIAPLIERCRHLIEPKAVFAFIKVTRIEKDEVRLGSGHTLRSIVLAGMLEHGQTVVPYVVTIGPGLEKQASEEAKGSVFRSWVLERLGDHALERACVYMKSHVKEALGGDVSSFSPGSGTGKLFGIEQQEVLFHILNPPESIGVSLTAGCMMVPRKSVSGVLAETRREYVACRYCPRERCENRSEPFSGEYYPLECQSKV